MSQKRGVGQPWVASLLWVILSSSAFAAADSIAIDHRQLFDGGTCVAAVLEGLSTTQPLQPDAVADGLLCVETAASAQAVAYTLTTDPRCVFSSTLQPAPEQQAATPPPAPNVTGSSTPVGGGGSSNTSGTLLTGDPIDVSWVLSPGWANGLLGFWIRTAHSGAVTAPVFSRYRFGVVTLPPAPYLVGGAEQVAQYTRGGGGAAAAAGTNGSLASSTDPSTAPLAALASITEDFEFLPETSCALSANATGPLHPRTYLLLWYRADALAALAAAATRGSSSGSSSGGGAGVVWSGGPPDDWEGLLAVLEAHRAAAGRQGGVAGGTAGLPRYGLCLTTNPHCGRLGDVLAAIAASVVQTRGSGQGYVFGLDVPPPAAEPLVNGTGWRYAAKLLRQLLSYNAPANTSLATVEAEARSPLDCHAVSPLFTDGDCMITMEWDAVLPYMVAAPALSQPGVLGVAPLPGSRWVVTAAVAARGSGGDGAAVGSGVSGDSKTDGQAGSADLTPCTTQLCAVSVAHDLLYGMYGPFYDPQGSDAAALLAAAPSTEGGSGASTNLLAAVAAVEAAELARLLGVTAPAGAAAPPAAAALLAARPAVNRAPYSAFFGSITDVDYGGIIAADGDVSILSAAFNMVRLDLLQRRLVRQAATDRLRAGLGVARRRAQPNATTCEKHVRTPWWRMAPHLLRPGGLEGSSSSSTGGGNSSSAAAGTAAARDAAVQEALSWIAKWRASPDVARSYLRAIWHAVHSPNAAPDVPAPSDPNWFRWAMGHAAAALVVQAEGGDGAGGAARRRQRALLQADASSPAADPIVGSGGGGGNASVDADVESAVQLMVTYFALATAELGAAAVREAYEAAISAPDWHDVNGNNGKGPGGDEGLARGALAGLIVGIQVGVLAVVALVGWVAWRRCLRRGGGGRRQRDLLGRVRAPRVSPGTTLLITDVQNSTGLWEALSVVTMDAALQLHHSTVRRVLAEHHGYESATEGDSFIVAFTCPAAAAAFATSCQLALLEADWPEELLAHPDGAMVLVEPREQHGAAAAALPPPPYGIGSFGYTVAGGGSGLSDRALSTRPSTSHRTASGAMRFMQSFLRGSSTGRPLLYGVSSVARSFTDVPAAAAPVVEAPAAPGDRGRSPAHAQTRDANPPPLERVSTAAAGDTAAAANGAGNTAAAAANGAGDTAAAAANGQQEPQTPPRFSLDDVGGGAQALPYDLSYSLRGHSTGQLQGLSGAPSPVPRLRASPLSRPQQHHQHHHHHHYHHQQQQEQQQHVEGGAEFGLAPSAPSLTGTLSRPRLTLPARGGGLPGSGGAGSACAVLPHCGDGGIGVAGVGGAGPGPSLRTSSPAGEARNAFFPAVQGLLGQGTMAATSAGARVVRTLPWRQALAAAFPVSPSSPSPLPSDAMLMPSCRGRPVVRLSDGRIVAFRGLRVRMGLHSGLGDPQCVTFNKVASSYQYSGEFAELTRLVSDTAPGGLVVMSGVAFTRLRNTVEQSKATNRAIKDVTVVYGGHHIIRSGGGGAAAAAAAAAAAPSPEPSVRDPKYDTPPSVTPPEPSGPSAPAIGAGGAIAPSPVSAGPLGSETPASDAAAAAGGDGANGDDGRHIEVVVQGSQSSSSGGGAAVGGGCGAPSPSASGNDDVPATHLDPPDGNDGGGAGAATPLGDVEAGAGTPTASNCHRGQGGGDADGNGDGDDERLDDTAAGRALSPPPSCTSSRRSISRRGSQEVSVASHASRCHSITASRSQLPLPPLLLQLNRSRGATLRHWRSNPICRDSYDRDPHQPHPTTQQQQQQQQQQAAPPSCQQHRLSTHQHQGYFHRQEQSEAEKDLQLDLQGCDAADEPHLAQPLYIAVPAGLLCRLALCAPLRSRWVSQATTLDAPTGCVTVAFLKVVGATTLLAELPGPAARALEQCQRLVCGLLGGAGGYLVEGCGDGLVLAAFGSPAAAVEWALDCVEGLKRLDWDPVLLAHELCEEVVSFAAHGGLMQSALTPATPRLNGGAAGSAAGSPGLGSAGSPHPPSSWRLRAPGRAEEALAPPAAVGGPPPSGPLAASRLQGSVTMQRQGATTLSRGLRIKVGIDMGAASCTITDSSGRLSYRGKVMNRAARIAGIAAAGQVLCSGAVWEEVAAAALGLPASGAPLPPPVAAISLGPMSLKGVKEPVEVLQCVFQA